MKAPGSTEAPWDGLAAWLKQLPAERLEALALDFASGLERDGLSVYDGAARRFSPIPAVLTAQPVAEGQLDRLRDPVQALLSSLVKAARWTLSAPDSTAAAALARRLYAGFTPFEMACLRRNPQRLQQVATARVDFFVPEQGQPWVLEVNATIPAMQGYSDILSRNWMRSLAAARGHRAAEIAQLVEGIPSNSAELFDSLLAHYRVELEARGSSASEHPAILIVSRRGDAQLSELRHYEGAFAERGHRALHVWADEVEADDSGRVRARSEEFDLVYRHIFARRISPSSALGRVLLTPGESVVLNPVLSPLEVKGLLAVLAEARDDDDRAAAIGLDEGERWATTLLLPWTRLLAEESATLADGARTPDLAAWVSEHPDCTVLKRSWDYGGRSVLLGPERDSDGFRMRAHKLFGDGSGGWRELVARATRDPDCWVVQEYVPPPRRHHLVVEQDASGRPRASWRELFVDLSLYTNLGVTTRPTGGACRASASPIVNILSGGALVPLAPGSVIENLLLSQR
jgi:hypothetical protein